MNGEHHRPQDPYPDHGGVRELLGMQAIDRLEEDEALLVQAHLDGCAECRAELAELRETATMLGGLDPERVSQTVAVPAVPAELGERVVAAVQRERAATHARTEAAHDLVSRRSQRVPRWVPVAVAAAAVAVVGAGVGYQLAPEQPTIPLETVAVQAAPGTTLDIAAGVVPHTWGMEIKLTGTGFTVGEDYQVRVLTDSGGQVSAGEFIGVGATTMRCNLNSAVLRSDADGFEVLDSAGQVVLSSHL